MEEVRLLCAKYVTDNCVHLSQVAAAAGAAADALALFSAALNHAV